MVRRAQVRSIAVLRMPGTDWSQVAYPQLHVHEPGCYVCLPVLY